MADADAPILPSYFSLLTSNFLLLTSYFSPFFLKSQILKS